MGVLLHPEAKPRNPVPAGGDGGLVPEAAGGAGVGEVVLYAAGSSARQTAVTKNRPVDHVIMAIVDEVVVEGDVTYRKGAAR